jgi:hypothetical protein
MTVLSGCFQLWVQPDDNRQLGYNCTMATDTNLPPVLILGCGRSGTSIFGELFQGLATYQYRSEPDFVDMLATFGQSRAAKVPIESGNFSADPGLSFPLNILLSEHPSTKIFWIVRHPFDAVCSLRIGIGNGWCHHPRPPDWETWLDRSLVERCAHHWAYINSYGYESVRDCATLVRYEDLVRSPLEFAEDVCVKVGLSPSDHIRTLKVWADRVQNTNNKQFVEALTSRTHSLEDEANLAIPVSLFLSLPNKLHPH